MKRKAFLQRTLATAESFEKYGRKSKCEPGAQVARAVGAKPGEQDIEAESASHPQMKSDGAVFKLRRWLDRKYHNLPMTDTAMSCTYIYDAENRIATVDGQRMYAYDAGGRRVAKYTSAGVTSSYLLRFVFLRVRFYPFREPVPVT